MFNSDKKGLYPLKSKTVKSKTIFGFDVETANNNKDFVLATLNGKDYLKTFHSKQELKKELLSNQIFRNSYIIATNLMFDFFATFSKDQAFNEFDVLERQGRVLCATSYIPYKNSRFMNKSDMQYMIKRYKLKYNDFRKIVFIDSLNHALLSVDNMGEILKIPKLEKPSFLGSYPKNKNQENILINYNIRDTEITKGYMEFLQKSYNELNGKMEITISSTALDVFRRNYLTQELYQEPKEKILFCYKGYYGGRTEAFKRGIFDDRKINVYDVNSLYPYVMQKYRYPNPNKSYFQSKPNIQVIYGNEGLGEFTLKSTDSYIPYLPFRSEKLLFPNGKIRGVYDFFSIRIALKLGYELESIGKCLVYPLLFDPYKNYVLDLYKKRKHYQEIGDTREIAIKYLLNSLYGKTGYNYKDKEIITNFNGMIQYTNSDKYSIYPINTNDLKDNNKFFRIATTENAEIPKYVFPILPLYVTSFARYELYKHFKNCGDKYLYYGDTDSIFTTRTLDTGNNLGDLKLEKTFKELCIVRPKFYGGLTTNEDIKKSNIVKVKGVNELKEYSLFKKMILSPKFFLKQNRFMKLRGSFHTKNGYINKVYEMPKEMDLSDDKRIWEKEKFTIQPQDSKAITII